MKKIVFYICFFLLSVSCYNSSTPTPDAWSTTDLRQIDSVSYFTTHDYSQNYNFLVKADTLRLVCQAPDELPFDSASVTRGDRVVVADIMIMPADTIDSVWVKIARDQATQGWVREVAMLPAVQPDDPISQFIDVFSDTHLLIFLAFAVIVTAIYLLRLIMRRHAHIVHFHDINSFYPMLLALLVSASAVFYATIQLFGNESWRHFYYHPSLNPFGLPFHLGIFVTSVWAIVIVGIATVDDVFRKLPFADALLYVSGLMAVCAVDYVVFSISALYYVGYLLLVVYIIWAVSQYLKKSRTRYYCGNCGREMTEKGLCGFCGAVNE